jgi:F0F1-type ATP synthase, epsilon subunit (mitochondrial delta subunit)
MATLRLEIVTPEAKTFSDDVDSVVIPGSEGDLASFRSTLP